MNTDSLKILVFNNNHRTIVLHKGKDQVFLVFDNEDEAVVYADQLEEIVTTVGKSSPVRSILRDVVTAIRNDDSIRNYLENSSIYTWVKNRVYRIRAVIKPYPTL